jgi:hypothetical protein
MGGYARAVSGHQLGKHVPIARQQILNIATVGPHRWKSYVFYMVRVKMIKQGTRSVDSSVQESKDRTFELEVEV